MVDFADETGSMKELEKKRHRRKLYKRTAAVTGALSACVICVVGLPLIMELYVLPNWERFQDQCGLTGELRISCFGIINSTNVTQTECQEAGCCWVVENGTAQCYHMFPTSLRYHVSDDTVPGQVYLTLPVKSRPSLRGIAKKVLLKTRNWTGHHVQITLMNETTQKKASIVEPFLAAPGYVAGSGLNETEYIVTYKELENAPGTGQPFTLKVQRRRENNRTIFNTMLGAFLITEDFLELTTILPSSDLYGLGLTSSPRLRRQMHSKWTLLSRISTGTEDKGWPGVHPFYLCVEQDGKAHGVLLATSSIVYVETTRYPTVTFRILNASSVDVHIFLGSGPGEVVQRMTAFVGRPQLPPMWALGFHTCRHEPSDSYEVISQLRHLKVPHESDCISSKLTAEAEYTLLALEEQEEWNRTRNLLRSQDQRLLLVHIPQVSMLEKYKDDPCDPNATSAKCEFLLSSHNGSISALPLDADEDLSYAVVDVFHSGYADWLPTNYKRLNDEIGFDGILLDQNTPVDVSQPRAINKYKDPPPYSKRCSKNRINFPFANFGPPLLFKNTICMDTEHKQQSMTHSYLHNVYGHKNLELAANAASKTRPKTRTFLSSMSTNTGSGRYGGHFGSNYKTTWQQLQFSLVHMLELSMYGVPMYGSAVCGSEGDPSYDLCSRWYQLSALMPFMFTSRRAKEDPVDPYSLRYIRDVARHTIQIRYTMLDYLYTQLELFSRTGQPFLRPLFFEFPQDPTALAITGQFFMGPALMVAPVVTPDTSTIKVYFPVGMELYNFFTWSYVTVSEDDRWLEVLASEYQVPMYLRAGSVVTSRIPNVTVALTQKNPLTVIVAARKKAGEEKLLAEGDIYIDDGVSTTSPSIRAHFEFRKNDYPQGCDCNSYVFRVVVPNPPPKPVPGVNVDIRKLVVLGLPGKPTNITPAVDYTLRMSMNALILTNLDSAPHKINLLSNHTIQIETER